MQDLELPSALTEVIEAVGGLKSRKAPCPDMIPSEFLVGGDLEMRKHLHNLLLKIWVHCTNTLS